MTDAALVAKKLASIETYVAELRRHLDVDRLESDVKEARFAQHTLQLALQAMLDVASHIVSDDRLGEPRSNRDMMALLCRAGWFDQALAATLARMVGFRNILVHNYDEVDPRILREVATTRLGDLEAFCRAIRARMDDAGR